MAHLPSLPIQPTLTSDRNDALLIVTLRRTTDDTKALLEAAINDAIEANGTSTSPTIYYAYCKDNAAQADVEWQGLDGMGMSLFRDYPCSAEKNRVRCGPTQDYEKGESSTMVAISGYRRLNHSRPARQSLAGR